MKNYLELKKISVKKIEELSGAQGIYRVYDGQGTFYVDENKNIFFGTVVNVETLKNLTLSNKSDKEVVANIYNGKVTPFEFVINKNNQASSVQFSEMEKNMMSIAEGYKKIINAMENSIEKLKLDKNKLEIEIRLNNEITHPCRKAVEMGL